MPVILLQNWWRWGLGDGELCTLLHIVRWARRDSASPLEDIDFCQRTCAKERGVNQSTISRHLVNLEKAGLAAITRREKRQSVLIDLRPLVAKLEACLVDREPAGLPEAAQEAQKAPPAPPEPSKPEPLPEPLPIPAAETEDQWLPREALDAIQRRAVSFAQNPDLTAAQELLKVYQQELQSRT